MSCLMVRYGIHIHYPALEYSNQLMIIIRNLSHKLIVHLGILLN